MNGTTAFIVIFATLALGSIWLGYNIIASAMADEGRTDPIRTGGCVPHPLSGYATCPDFGQYNGAYLDNEDRY